MSDPDKICFVSRAYLQAAQNRGVQTDAGLLVRERKRNIFFGFFVLSFAVGSLFFFLSRFSFSASSLPRAHQHSPLPSPPLSQETPLCERLTLPKNTFKKQFAFLSRYEEFVTPEFIQNRARSEQEKADAAAEKAQAILDKTAEKEAEREAKKAERAAAAANKKQKTVAE